MTRLAAFAMSLALSTGVASAAEPLGDWRVDDGTAHIRIANCSGTLWGVISWEKTPGIDSENPDPAKRNRPTLGMPILLAMKPANATKWEGEVYNAKNGKIYKASITALSNDNLKIEGCILGGIFCGGEKWTKVATPVEPSNLSGGVCSRLSGVPGFSHQGRLN